MVRFVIPESVSPEDRLGASREPFELLGKRVGLENVTLVLFVPKRTRHRRKRLSPRPASERPFSHYDLCHRIQQKRSEAYPAYLNARECRTRVAIMSLLTGRLCLKSSYHTPSHFVSRSIDGVSTTEVWWFPWEGSPTKEGSGLWIWRLDRVARLFI